VEDGQNDLKDAGNDPKGGQLGGIICVILPFLCSGHDPSPPDPPKPINICAAKCEKSCSKPSTLPLPPIQEDCDAIVNEFATRNPQKFTVGPGKTFDKVNGTCRVFFQNNGTKELEYCWKEFGEEAKATAAPCFPPHQPFLTLGICSSGDTNTGVWGFTIGHSEAP